MDTQKIYELAGKAKETLLTLQMWLHLLESHGELPKSAVDAMKKLEINPIKDYLNEIRELTKPF